MLQFAKLSLNTGDASAFKCANSLSTWLQTKLSFFRTMGSSTARFVDFSPEECSAGS